ncbi:biotin transporter BioY [Haloarchaeobius sp. TZWWS8]|uniref:biotin transporter BioY n=1 Tax=Haloarchaeobius sp. TZWWS8 TaxID=3446121 RepID=UPI003EBFA50A
MSERDGHAGEYSDVDLVGGETTKMIAASAMFAALTAALAQVSIPMPGMPPVTLQTTAVFLAGLLLGARWAGVSMGLYLVTGAAGAPVFANGGAGLGALFGYTGGFLFGYLVAAVLIGAIVHRGPETRSLDTVSTATQVGAIVLGIVVIYVVGTPWMAEVLGWSLTRAFTVMLPYLPGDLIELAAVVALVRAGDLDALAE